MPGVARLWLSPNGLLVVRTPFDRATAALLAALPKEARTWDNVDKVWRVVPDLVADVRRILIDRFEVADEHPEIRVFAERRDRLRERAVLQAACAEMPDADVIDLAAVRRRVRGGAA